MLQKDGYSSVTQAVGAAHRQKEKEKEKEKKPTSVQVTQPQKQEAAIRKSSLSLLDILFN